MYLAFLIDLAIPLYSIDQALAAPINSLCASFFVYMLPVFGGIKNL
jgi:hypothetical protein